MPSDGAAEPGTILGSHGPVVPAVLALFTFLVWAGSIRNGFVFDDLVNIVANPWIKDWNALSNAFAAHAAGFDPGFETSFFRPAMHGIYACTYALAGLRPWAFHLVNILFHVCNVLCVYALTRTLLARWGPVASSSPIPVIAAVVFSVHPIHTEAVAWVAGITDLSYTLLSLLALIAYVGSFRSGRVAFASGLFLLAALLCKETAVVVVPIVVLLESIEARRNAAWTVRAALGRLGPVVVAVASVLVLRLAAMGSLAPSAAMHPHGIADLLTTSAGLFGRYMGLLVAPVHFNAVRSIPVGVGFADPIVLAGVLTAGGLAALAIRLRRSWLSLLAIAVAVLPVLPVLYVPALEGGPSLFGERYLYLPVLGVGWGLGLVLDAVRRRFAWGRSVSIAVVAGIVLVSVPAVIARSRVWSDSLRLWSDAVAKSPENAAAHEGLCFALYDAGRFDDALKSCATAIAFDPSRTDARINHATALLALGRASEAIAEFDQVLALRPDDAQALVNRGLACMALGRPEEAMESYRRAIEVDPGSAEAHNDLGVALYLVGREDEAMRHFQEAVALAPDNPEYRANLEAGQGGGLAP